MSDEQALLRAICDDRGDDTPRLAYADWLEENGNDARAEFIRVQCELHRLADEADRRTELEVLERQLLARHAAGWALPRPPFPTSLPSPRGDEHERYWSVFRRGFLEGVALHELSTDHLAQGGEFEQLFAAHPIRELRLRSFQPGSLSALADRAELARVESLELTEFPDHDESNDRHLERAIEVETLLRSPRLGRLRALELTLFPTAVGVPVRWLRLPVFSRLQQLDCWPKDEDREEFWNVLAEGACPELTDLRLPWGYSSERPESAIRFSSSPACNKLVQLHISLADVGEPFPWAQVFSSARLQRLEVSAGSGTRAPELLDALASTPATNELRSLRLFGITATGAGVADWLESGYAVGVRDLAIEFGRLNDDDLEHLAGTPALARLTRLSLSGYTEWTPRGLQKFFASPYLSGLRYLDLSDTGLTATAILHLARSGSLQGLRVLCLGELAKRRRTDRPVVVNLGRGKPFPNLHTLKTWFFQGEQKPEELSELLDSAKLPNLVVLRTGFPVARLADWKKFASGTRLDWIGGSIDVNGGFVALHPPNVYLPNHLDDFGW